MKDRYQNPNKSAKVVGPVQALLTSFFLKSSKPLSALFLMSSFNTITSPRSGARPEFGREPLRLLAAAAPTHPSSTVAAWVFSSEAKSDAVAPATLTFSPSRPGAWQVPHPFATCSLSSAATFTVGSAVAILRAVALRRCARISASHLQTLVYINSLHVCGDVTKSHILSPSVPKRRPNVSQPICLQ